MTIEEKNSYKPHYFFRSKHFNTIYRTVFQQIEIEYERKRIQTPDRDFLDLDFSKVESKKLVLIIHGLEGSSNSNYVKSISRVLNQNNYDVVVMNLRGCSGEPNRFIYSYHSGKTDDLQYVLDFLIASYSYSEIHLVGYSLGGNIILKYLGDGRFTIPESVKSAVTVSVPCDLKASSEALAGLGNYIYMQRFLKSLKIKANQKLKTFSNTSLISLKINQAKNFYDFDNYFTAPVHGFKDAYDYWKKCSSKQFIFKITTPTLLITSLDDPFLTKSCIPTEEAKNNKLFNLELYRYGGHVGFNTNFNQNSIGWLENRILNFLLEYTNS